MRLPDIGYDSQLLFSYNRNVHRETYLLKVFEAWIILLLLLCEVQSTWQLELYLLLSVQMFDLL